MDPTNNREKKMALTYKQVIYIFNRSIDWLYLSDYERTERMIVEMQRIDWDRIPDEQCEIDYREYYKEQ